MSWQSSRVSILCPAPKNTESKMHIIFRVLKVPYLHIITAQKLKQIIKDIEMI